MLHYIYKITNTFNEKEYVGRRSTSKYFLPEEDYKYMGSGIVIKQAMKKYGKENFKKEIISVHKNKETLIKEEEKIVNRKYVDNKNTYNLRLGGPGALPGKDNHFYGKKHSKKSIEIMRKKKKNSIPWSKGKKLGPMNDDGKKVRQLSSPKRKKITVDDITYESMNAAGKAIRRKVKHYTIENLRKEGFTIYF
tara:strand:- start:6186 stop:6764 length:579 start_codon:yes stop_codon:yes gene_type:complete